MGNLVSFKKAAGLIYVGVFALLSSGCATIIHGTTQGIGISSNPDKAKVTVNGQNVGETPLTIDLKRNRDHTIVFEKEGYETGSATLTSGTSGWTLGNIIFGGLIGFGVDAASGGLRKLSSDTVHVNLIPKAAKSISTEGTASGQNLRVGDSVDIVKRLRGEPLGQFSWQRWMALAFPGPKSSQVSLAIFRDGILTTIEVKDYKTLPKGEVIRDRKQGDVAEVWGEPHKMFFEGQEQAWIYAETDKLHAFIFEGGMLKNHEAIPLLRQ